MSILVGKLHKIQKGITGLETAIILIAFVVVAAVFAYTVLSAGMFSSQKSQEAVYSGLEEARATVQMNGSFIAKDTDDDEDVDEVVFTVMQALDGVPIDFTVPPNNTMVVSYIDMYQRHDDMTWSLTKLGSTDTDDLLEVGEKFQITVAGLDDGGANELTPKLQKNSRFTFELKPAVGAVLIMERTTPKVVDPVMDLH